MKIYIPLRNNLEGQELIIPKTNKYILLYTTFESMYKYIQRSNSNFKYYTKVDSSLINIDKSRFNKDGEISAILPISFKVGKCYNLKVNKYIPRITNRINEGVTWPIIF